MSVTIGILGGMGPRATVEFESRLVSRFIGSDQSVPTIITVNDGSIPDRGLYLQGGGEDPMPILLKNALALQSLGADIIAIPCNTACAPLIYDRLIAFLETPVINLPQITAEIVSNSSADRIALLATSGSIQSRSFQDQFAPKGIELILPDKETQLSVDGLIRSIKLSTPDRNSLDMVSRFLEKSCAKVAILGCTELPMVKVSILPSGVVGIDTLDILVEACVEYTIRKGEFKCRQTNTLMQSQC